MKVFLPLSSMPTFPFREVELFVCPFVPFIGSLIEAVAMIVIVEQWSKSDLVGTVHRDQVERAMSGFQG
jgi:hypothetical protein